MIFYQKLVHVDYLKIIISSTPKLCTDASLSYHYMRSYMGALPIMQTVGSNEDSNLECGDCES